MKTLLYCPLPYGNDEGMWPPTTSPTLYFHWQDWLWHAFDKQEHFRVIWNAFIMNSNMEDPIQYRQSKVVRYARWKIGRALNNSDCLLVDHPSTVVLDAMLRKKPVLCVSLWDHEWLRDFPFIVKANGYEKAFNTIMDFMAFMNLKIETHPLTINQADWLKRITK
jgi:hypothetical protein